MHLFSTNKDVHCQNIDIILGTGSGKKAFSRVFIISAKPNSDISPAHVDQRLIHFPAGEITLLQKR